MATERFSGEYLKYIVSEGWKKKAEARKKIDGYKCVVCGRKEGLEVHHLSYQNLGDENIDKDIVTLCKECHKEAHDGKNYIVNGIVSGILHTKMEYSSEGWEGFFKSIGINNENIKSKYLAWLEDRMTVLAIPIPNADKGAVVIPFYNRSASRKDQEKMAQYLNTNLFEVELFARRIYQCAREDGCFISEGVSA